jgi:hypothetical protein
VGEPNGAGGVEKGDFYQVTLPAGGGTPVFTNLTNTSGDTAVPVLSKGEIETSDGVYQIPGQTGMVFYVDGPSGQGEIYRLSGTTGDVDLVRSGIASVDFIERAGSSFVLGILHDLPTQRELIQVPFDHALSSTSLGIFGTLETFAAHAGNASGTFAGLVNVTGGQRLVRFSLTGGTVEVLPGTAQAGPTLGFEPAGAVVAAVKDSVRAYFIAWEPSGSVDVYGSGPLQSFVLPAE